MVCPILVNTWYYSWKSKKFGPIPKKHAIKLWEKNISPQPPNNEKYYENYSKREVIYRNTHWLKEKNKKGRICLIVADFINKKEQSGSIKARCGSKKERFDSEKARSNSKKAQSGSKKERSGCKKGQCSSKKRPQWIIFHTKTPITKPFLTSDQKNLC